jgi:two-component system, response regulator RegA
MILIVEDDAAFRERLARALRDRGHEVVTAGDFEAAMLSAERHGITHAVIDLKLPGSAGLDVLQQLKRSRPHLHAIILTGFADFASQHQAKHLGAAACLRKSVNADELLEALGLPAVETQR